MYTSRIVGTGEHKGRPIVSFTLASKSIPFRRLTINPEQTKVNVFPLSSFAAHPTNQNPEVDKYACLVTKSIPQVPKIPQDISGSVLQEVLSGLQNKVMIAFNGHMSKRALNNMRDGMPPQIALDSTLFEFRGAKNDARIAAAAYQDYAGDRAYFLGVNDADSGEKRVKRYPAIHDRLFFIYDKKTTFESKFGFLDTAETSAEGLAKYIHENIVGEEILFGQGTAVGILTDNGKFELGVFNADVTEATVARWQKAYDAEKR